MKLTPYQTHDTPSVQTVQQHHVQAADQLEQAARCHNAAARLISAGDHRGAQVHAERAKAHTALASEHVIQANKRGVSPTQVPA